MIVALAGSLIFAYPASTQAQLLLDQFMGGSAGAGTELGSAAHAPLDTNTIVQRLQQQGYSNINLASTNPQQFTAISPIGTAVVLTVEPMTGQVITVTPQ